MPEWAVRRYDLQRLRRDVMIDLRTVDEGDIDAREVLLGVIERLTIMLDNPSALVQGGKGA